MSTKEQVLAALAKEDAISGEYLARKLGVSRSAVWKAIEALRADGCTIEAVTNRGYRLMEEAKIVTEASIRRALTARELGRRIEVHDELDSTNIRAKALAMQGAANGTLICARGQTAGRGRFGRSFHAPMDAGAFMSLVLRPEVSAERAVLLTSMAAVATARAIERLADVRVEIKWVNDLYVGGRKVCGILSEAGMDFESGRLEYAVVGIGVNLARMKFPEPLREIATSIGNECGAQVSPSRLIAEICNCLEPLYETFDPIDFMQESRVRSNVLGRRIVVLRGNERFSAEAVDIDDCGGLVIRTARGLETVSSGEISVRWEDAR